MPTIVSRGLFHTPDSPDPSNTFMWSSAGELNRHMVRLNGYAWVFHRGVCDAPVPVPHMSADRANAELLNEWGVVGTGEVRSVLEKMLEPRHEIIADTVIELGQGLIHLPPKELEQAIAVRGQFLADLANSLDWDIDASRRAMKVWGESLKYIDLKYPLAPRWPHTIKAWNVLRAGLLARTALSANVLPAERVLEVDARAVALLQSLFSSWAEVMASYWWGELFHFYCISTTLAAPRLH